MSRKCKCKICNKDLNTDIAYQAIYKNKKMYCCNEEEFSKWLLEKDSYSLITPIVFDILGYNSTNTLILKEIKILHENYTYKQILTCFEQYKDYIKKCLSNKNIQNEYSKIKYIFTIIKNNIADVQIIQNENNDKETINIDDYGTGFNYRNIKNTNFLDIL